MGIVRGGSGYLVFSCGCFMSPQLLFDMILEINED